MGDERSIETLAIHTHPVSSADGETLRLPLYYKRLKQDRIKLDPAESCSVMSCTLVADVVRRRSLTRNHAVLESLSESETKINDIFQRWKRNARQHSIVPNMTWIA
jgi:hypothetical protein